LAEDGIRDRNVTGVQTCALPIFNGATFSFDPIYNPDTFSMKVVMGAVSIAVLSFLGFDAISTLSEESAGGPKAIGKATIWSILRSEERRVGKEFRYTSL